MMKTKKMKIIMTGGTGFIGSYLLRELVSKGYNVILLIRSSSDTTRINKINAVQTIRIEKEKIEKTIPELKADGIIHCATSYGNKGETPLEVFDTNVYLPLRLLHLAEKCNLKFFINTDTVLPPHIGVYCASKNAFKYMLKLYGKYTKMCIINMRLHYVYGLNNKNKHSFVVQVFESNKTGKKIFATDGTQQRDFVYIKDVVSAYMRAISAIENGKITSGFTEIEIGSGKSYSLREFVNLLDFLSKRKTNIKWGAISNRINEPKILKADIAKARKFIKWEPKYTLKDGLEEVLKGL